MMTDLEFDIWCAKNHVEKPAIMAIQRIRQGNPSRNVRSGAGHVSGKFASRKMGLTLQYESGTLEYPTLFEFESDASILEYYDQPTQLQVSYVRSNGKRDSFTHYPDFFVIRKDGCGYVECKYHQKLQQLQEKHPERYFFNNIEWHSLPCEEKSRELGFTYEIRTERNLNMTLYHNLRYLANYERHLLSDELRGTIMQIVRDDPGITLFDLVQTCDPDSVNKMILTRDLYVDLHRHRLSNPEFVPVYPDELTSQALTLLTTSKSRPVRYPSPISLVVNSRISWSGQLWTVGNVSTSDITLIGSSGDGVITLTKSQFEVLVQHGDIEGPKPDMEDVQKQAHEILKRASPRDLQEANYRANQVERFQSGDKSVLQEVPERTLRDWSRKSKLAMQMYGIGYLGLLSKHERKGRRDSRLDPDLVKKMDDYIARHFENPTQETRKSVYERFKIACREEGFIPPSFKTFLRALHKRAGYIQTLKREGRRTAYQGKHPYIAELSIAEATRPLERAHCDHTPLDIVLVDSQTGLTLGKPWLTCLIDDYSRRILGSYITFEAPSAASCLMVLRDSIRRFQRLPDELVIDNGKEFHSIAFETFLAAFGVHHMYRPPAEPRFGNRIERYFGTNNTQFLFNLKGNSQAAKKPRQLTKATDPRNNSVWTLRKLTEVLNKYMYEQYDTFVNASTGFSPRELYQGRIRITGGRDQQLIPYTPVIDILTLPPTPKGTLRVQRSGVKFEGRYYWNSGFSASEVHGKDVPVVYDPMDAGVVYAYFKGQWHKCACRHAEFHGRSVKELQIVSAEYRKRHKLRLNQTESYARLARFIKDVKDEEYELQVRRDRAIRECNSVDTHNRNMDDLEDMPFNQEHSRKNTVQIDEEPPVTIWNFEKRKRF